MKHFAKIAALLLTVAMLVTMAGCSNETAGSGEGAANGDFKVGVIHIGDPADGSGYSYAHDLGIVAMQENLKLDDSQVIRKINVNDGDAAATRTAIEECIEEGCKLIFGTSWGYMDTMEQLAAEYPDVMFSHGTGYKSNGTNFNNYFGRIYQARYLSGIAAGLKTASNKIGYVAAMDIQNSEVTGGINAFAMGVESVNPEAQVFVKVTNSWFSPDLEKQAAEALLDMGCDVIAQHCDTTAPQLAAQSRGAFGCGYNSDMTKDAPQAHLTAPIWNWGVYYTKAAQAVMEGTWDAANYFGGMDDGLVDISPLSENCAEGTEEAIEAAKAKIKDGTFKVFEGELFDNKGNQVCAAGEVISDADITGAMNWYYRNVVAE
ncbi:MAG: BMP family ABC transporter substrate-binding protein [Ruminococcaceae bacterium]|nr:BMP family ABC transporter substrate-binding protein [Oscillospiraceae bacterium]